MFKLDDFDFSGFILLVFKLFIIGGAVMILYWNYVYPSAGSFFSDSQQGVSNPEIASVKNDIPVQGMENNSRGVLSYTIDGVEITEFEALKDRQGLTKCVLAKYKDSIELSCK